MERLTPERLCQTCDPSALDFESTEELAELDEILGQERAVEAIRFAASIAHDGYNLFVLGPTGTGRHHLVQRLLARLAAERPVADDWCYTPARHAPRALRLPPGRGVALKDDMARLVEDLYVSIPAAFDTDEYRRRLQAIERDFEKRRQQAVASVREEAARRNVAVVSGEDEVGLAPLADGKPLSLETVEALSEQERGVIEENLKAVHQLLQESLRNLPRWVSQRQESLRALDGEISALAIDHLVDALRERWSELPAVLDFLEEIRADVKKHAARFRVDRAAMAEQAPQRVSGEDTWARRFSVNVLVDRSNDQGAPLVYEDNPTLHALVGRVEQHASLVDVSSELTHIRPGALHRANGGFLVLDAAKILTKPLAWEHLKRALRSKEVRIESMGQALNMVSTVSLEPEPIPLELLVVLVGDRSTYQLLLAMDPEFGLLFKVPADVEDRVDRTPENTRRFARLVATLARRDGLLAFDREAVARVITRASRMAGDSGKLSTHLDSLTDLLREADHYARVAGRERVGCQDVVGAVSQERRRHGRIRDISLEEMLRGTLAVQTEGAVVGQVNGLTVLSLGRGAFGRPARITARVRVGAGVVLDVEREVELGGALHSKGVLILTGYIGARYAPEQPLALSASLVFEQSYGPVDGDSASLGEAVALLSALGELPVLQSVAVTGSIDQRGRVQAIGGANEKIEGFYDLCAARGLSGEQGVVLPAANARHLMLRQDVLEAVEAERFHVWTVETVDEALALMTGEEAGERGADGAFPEGSANARVEARLVRLAERARDFARGTSG